MSFLLLPFICLLFVPFGLEFLEGIAYILLPATIPAPSTRPGPRAYLLGEGRRAGREGVEEMKERRRVAMPVEGGKEEGLGVGSPASPPLLLHAILFQISVVAFT